MLIQVGVICHKPYDNPLLERCLDSLVRIPAGITYNLATQFSEGTYAQNWNRLMDKCKADFVCVLEDDTAALKPNWLRSLVDTALVYRDAAIVMPIETKDCVSPDPGFRQWLDKTASVATTYGFCNLIRREAGLKADENLNYFTDVDLAFQANASGWKCYVNGHVWMLHGCLEGRMNSPDQNVEDKQLKCREYLERKWRREAA